MATLKIWNIEDEIVLEDEGPWDALEDLLDAFKQEHDLDSSGGLAYEFNVSVYDEMLLLKDELEDDDGNIVGRYELKV